MRKDMLIKLLSELQSTSLSKFEKRILFSNQLINIENFFCLTDDEVNDIVDTRKMEVKVSKIYLYSNKKSIPDDIKESFGKIIETDCNIYNYLKVLERFYYLEREDGFDCIRSIIGAKGDVQRACAFELANIMEFLKLDNSLQIIGHVAKLEENESIDVKDEMLSMLNGVSSIKEHYSNIVLFDEKNIKEMFDYDSLGDLILGLKESNKDEISVDTKVKVRTKYQVLV